MFFASVVVLLAVVTIFLGGTYWYLNHSRDAHSVERTQKALQDEERAIELIYEINEAEKKLDRADTESARVTARYELERLLDEQASLE